MHRSLTICVVVLFLFTLGGCGGDSATQVSSTNSGSDASAPAGGPPPPFTPSAGPAASSNADDSSGGSDSSAESSSEEDSSASGASRSPISGGATGYPDDGESSSAQSSSAQSSSAQGSSEHASAGGGSRSPMGSGAVSSGGSGEHASAGGSSSEYPSSGSRSPTGGDAMSSGGSEGSSEHETFVEPDTEGSGGAGRPDALGGIPGAEGNPGAGRGYPAAGGGSPGSGSPGSGFAGATPPPEPKPLTLQEKAEEAIRTTSEKAAFDYLYASVLADDDSPVLKKYGFSNALKRPTPAVRWGLGVNVTVSPKIYEGSYFPLGSTQDIPDRVSLRNSRTNRNRRGTGGGYGGYGRNRGGRSGMAPGGEGSGGGESGGAGEESGYPGAEGTYPGSGYPGAGGGPGDGNAAQVDTQILSQAAGDLSERFITRLRESIEKGEYGELLVELAEARRRPSTPPRNLAGSGYAAGGARGPGYGAGPGGPGRGYPGRDSSSSDSSMTEDSSSGMTEDSSSGMTEESSSGGDSSMDDSSGFTETSEVEEEESGSDSSGGFTETGEMEEEESGSDSSGGFTETDTEAESESGGRGRTAPPGVPGGGRSPAGGGYPGDAYPGSGGGYPSAEGSYPGSGYPGSGYPGGGRPAPVVVEEGSLAPGLRILGEGDYKKLLDKAEEQGLDVLVMFECKVTQNLKTGFVTNETNLVVWDVRLREDVFKTKKLNNITVQKQRAEDEDEEDPVDAVLDKLFAELTAETAEGLKLRDFPEAVRPEHVKGRIVTLLSGDQLEQLPVLAEIKFYHSRGLIDDATLTKSFQKVLGELDGAKLSEGKLKERLEVVENLLPRES